MPSWKKIIVSGSNAELNHITSSGGININGTLNSISDGLTFGDGDTGFYQAADDDLILKRGGNTVFRANTSSQLDIEVSTLFYNTTGGFNIKTAAGVVGAPNYTFRGDTNTGMYRSAADTIGFTAGGVLQLEVTTNKISGSATSTGSFGKLLGDGSSLTGIDTDLSGDTTPQLGGNLDLNSNNITGTGNIDILGTITAQNFIVSSSVTSIEYQSISGSTIFGDTEDDTHEFIGHVMMQSASFGMANHADRTNSNAANSYLFISQSVASKNGYVWQKAGNPGTNTFPFLLIDGANNQKASIRQDGRFSTPIVYLSNDNSGKLGEIDGDAGDSSAMYINANSRALQLSSEGKKTFKINTDGTTEIGGSGAYGVTNFGDLTVGGNLNLTSSAATLEVAGNISGSATSTGSFGRVEATKLVGDGSGITGLTSAAISSYTNNGNNRIITSVNSSTVNGEANLTFDGSTLDVTGDLTLSGDLTVNGTTTTIATTNLQIQDAFGFFATGSAGTNVDAGIIVQSGSFIDSGSALYHDISKERWSVGKGIASTATNVPDSKWGGFVATVYTASASPVGSSPKYGVGEIHVDDDGEIYIYS